LKLDKALPIAQRLVRHFEPYCYDIEIAGSVRRRKPTVGDIEIVAIPKSYNTDNLFGESTIIGYQTDDAVKYLMEDGGSQLIKNGDRYKQIALPEGINLDLFLVLPPAQWGVIYTLRTGPAEFNKWIVTKRKYGGALPSDCKMKDGAIRRGGQIIPMPAERDFLSFLGLPPDLPPWERKPKMEIQYQTVKTLTQGDIDAICQI
jgi:DNA polymerase/3'-5' exonuclease PolX